MWEDVLSLHDPGGLFLKLKVITSSVRDADYEHAARRVLDRDAASAMGDIRNAVLEPDRATFLLARMIYARALCRALCLLERRCFTEWARLREMKEQLLDLPAVVETQLDMVSGMLPATDQEAYDAAEELGTRFGGARWRG
jgi:hypothetical protein